MSLNGLLVGLGLIAPSEDGADEDDGISAALPARKEMDQSDFKAQVNSNKDEPGKAIGKKGALRSSPVNTAGTNEANDRKPTRRSESMNITEVMYISEENKAKEAEDRREELATLYGNALGLFGPNNCFRRFVSQYVQRLFGVISSEPGSL